MRRRFLATGRAGRGGRHDRPRCRCGGERVSARVGRAGLRGARRRGGLVRRAANGACARGGADGRRFGARRCGGTGRRRRGAVRRSAGPRGVPGVAGGGARRARRARGPTERLAASATGAVLQPEVGRRQGGALQTRRRGAQAWDRADRARPALGPRGARPRRAGSRRRRARDGRRRRLAGDRRGDRRRARPALRVHPGRYAQPLRARSRRRPRRRRRRAGRVRRRRGAGRGPRRGQRSCVRQQRLARPLRRGRPASGVPRREDPHAARHRARRARPRQRREARPALQRPGRADAPLGRHGAGLQQPLPARPRDRLGHAAADRRRPARDHGRRRT